MKTETHRRFARLTAWLRGVEGLTPAERDAADRLLAELGRKRTVEIVPQCQGEQDENGNALCNGTDVRRVTFQVGRDALERRPVFGANWCADCRALARNTDDGRVILSISAEALPPLPTSYPCKNAFCSVGGKPRRVARQGEYCTTSCMMEDLNESKEGSR